MSSDDIMKAALAEAHKAFAMDEVPVGAVIVMNNKIISSAHNLNRKMKNSLKHAEMIVIDEASAYFNNERLIDCELYVTKEPCAMCAGAIVHSRISKVIIGVRDRKYGACGTVLNVCGNNLLNHVPHIEFGLLEAESERLLKEFFKNKRK